MIPDIQPVSSPPGAELPQTVRGGSVAVTGVDSAAWYRGSGSHQAELSSSGVGDSSKQWTQE